MTAPSRLAPAGAERGDRRRNALYTTALPRFPWSKHREGCRFPAPRPATSPGPLEEADCLDGPLYQAIREELARRFGLYLDAPTVKPPADLKGAVADIVAAGYRTVALHSCPECGRDHAAMVRVNGAKQGLHSQRLA